MGARSKARKRALDILFEADVVGVDVRTTLQARIARAEPPVAEYAVELVEGVVGRREEIDRLLGEYAQGWTLDRMPAVDRNILRIGVYELLWRDDVPDGVAISEAVEMARTLSTDESPRFVNGLLATIGEHRPQPAPEEPLLPE